MCGLQGWYIGVRKNPLEVGPRFNATRLDFSIADRVQASVDVGTGNLSVTSTELSVPGIDKDIQLGMTFNSLLLGTSSPLPKGAGGFGWAHRFGQDSELQANTDGSVVYLAPGGTQGKYVPSSSSAYRSPAGFKEHPDQDQHRLGAEGQEEQRDQLLQHHRRPEQDHQR